MLDTPFTMLTNHFTGEIYYKNSHVTIDHIVIYPKIYSSS